jgi:hypothetical protein
MAHLQNQYSWVQIPFGAPIKWTWLYGADMAIFR